ncbi:MAG: invasion associated locus B family protein [Pseudomonadota bacterium]
MEKPRPNSKRGVRRLGDHLIALASMLVMAVSASIASPAHAQSTDAPTSEPKPAVRAQHGDWQIVCKKPIGARTEVCAAVQDVTSEDNPNVGLSVHFQKASDGSRTLRIFAPLGLLLPPGLGLNIDEAKVGRIPFVRCHVVGCLAHVTVDEKLMTKLNTGTTAWFIVFQTREAGIGIPVSLNGLSDAIAGLQQ